MKKAGSDSISRLNLRLEWDALPLDDIDQTEAARPVKDLRYLRKIWDKEGQAEEKATKRSMSSYVVVW